MDQLRPGFDAGGIKAFRRDGMPLARGAEAYEAADRDGAAAKHVLLPA